MGVQGCPLSCLYIKKGKSRAWPSSLWLHLNKHTLNSEKMEWFLTCFHRWNKRGQRLGVQEPRGEWYPEGTGSVEAGARALLHGGWVKSLNHYSCIGRCLHLLHCGKSMSFDCFMEGKAWKKVEQIPDIWLFRTFVLGPVCDLFFIPNLKQTWPLVPFTEMWKVPSHS